MYPLGGAAERESSYFLLDLAHSRRKGEIKWWNFLERCMEAVPPKPSQMNFKTISVDTRLFFSTKGIISV